MTIMKQAKCPVGHRPVYCKDIAVIAGNVTQLGISADTGKVLWYNYKCKVCGATIILAELDYKDISVAGVRA